jgi:hypothetical protein
VVSFAYRHGERPDELWRRQGKYTPVREYPRRKWRDAVARVLDGNSTLSVRRFPPKDGSYDHASHLTRDGRPRLFDHILVSEDLRSPVVSYDISVLGDGGNSRLSDHAIVFADLSSE